MKPLFEKAKNWYELGRYYRYFLKEFPVENQNVITQKLKQLEQSNEYKNSLKEWDSIRDAELSLQKLFLKECKKLGRQSVMVDSIHWWWVREVGKLS